MKKKRGAKDQTTETTQTDTPHRNKKRPDRTTTNRKPQTTQNSHSASKSNKQLDIQQVFQPKKTKQSFSYSIHDSNQFNKSNKSNNNWNNRNKHKNNNNNITNNNINNNVNNIIKNHVINDIVMYLIQKFGWSPCASIVFKDAGQTETGTMRT